LFELFLGVFTRSLAPFFLVCLNPRLFTNGTSIIRDHNSLLAGGPFAQQVVLADFHAPNLCLTTALGPNLQTEHDFRLKCSTFNDHLFQFAPSAFFLPNTKAFVLVRPRHGHTFTAAGQALAIPFNQSIR
jgi:hypothetical protein